MDMSQTMHIDNSLDWIWTEIIRNAIAIQLVGSLKLLFGVFFPSERCGTVQNTRNSSFILLNSVALIQLYIYELAYSQKAGAVKFLFNCGRMIILRSQAMPFAVYFDTDWTWSVFWEYVSLAFCTNQRGLFSRHLSTAQSHAHTRIDVQRPDTRCTIRLFIKST